MASPLTQEFQSLQEEVTELAGVMSRVQLRLADISHRTEERGGIWKARVVELENQNKEYLNKANWLHQQNAQLERKISQWKPEMDNAISARNAAFRKLRNTRKVVRDLIDERLQEEERKGASPPNSLDSEEIARILRQANTTSSGSGSSRDTDSDRTIGASRPNPSPSVKRSSMSVAGGSRSPRHEEGSPANSPNSGGESDYTTHLDDPSESVMATPTQSSDISVHPATESQADSTEQWRVHYSRPPASASMSTGPHSHSKLVRCAIIKGETVKELKSLDLGPEFGLRLHLVGDRAFLYDPIFLEGPGRTYIIEWSRGEVNQKIKEYITRGGARTPVFHTFTFPTTENSHKWYYIGMHSWVVTELSWIVWESLGRKSRQKLLKKLSERCHLQIEERDIVTMLENGELTQFCIEISSNLYKVGSEKFARRLGHGPRPDTRTQLAGTSGNRTE